MGRKSPPPPQVIMPPPPPPSTIVTDVTPTETYQDATDYLRRLDAREEAIEKRRWDAGETPGNIRSSHAAIDLRNAELANNLDRGASFPGTPNFGSQTKPGLMAGTGAVMNTLGTGANTGSTSRQARIRPGQMSPTAQAAAVTGPEARLAHAQKAYWLADQQKKNEQFSYPDFEEPSWADRDWYPVVDKWKERSDKIEVDDSPPRVVSM